MGVYIGENSSSCTLKSCEFYVNHSSIKRNELFKNRNSYGDISIHMGSTICVAYNNSVAIKDIKVP